MKNTVRKIGEVGVDAGLLWLGDPCYIIHADPPAKEVGKDWPEFCDNLWKKEKVSGSGVQFNYDLGHAGLGVCVGTGYGDGTYPVYGEFNEEGRCMKVWVDFNENGTSQERFEHVRAAQMAGVAPLPETECDEVTA